MKTTLLCGVSALALTLSVAMASAQVLPPPPGPPGGGAAKAPSSSSGGGKGGGSGAAIAGYVIASNGCFVLATAGHALSLNKGPIQNRRETTPREARDNLLKCANIGAFFYLGIPEDNACSKKVAEKAYRLNNTQIGQEQRWYRDAEWEKRQIELMKEYSDCYFGKPKVTVSPSSKSTPVVKQEAAAPKASPKKLGAKSPVAIQKTGFRFVPPHEWAPSWQLATEEFKYSQRWFETR